MTKYQIPMDGDKVDWHALEDEIYASCEKGGQELTTNILQALVSHAKAEERAACHAEIAARWNESADGSEGKYWIWRAMEVISKGGEKTNDQANQ